jgi:SAM-dependent methyltransferase
VDLSLANHIESLEELSNDAFLYSGTELDAMAEARRYRTWILSYFKPFLGRHILEVGAGNGTFSQLLFEQAKGAQLVLQEPAANLFPLLKRRFSDTPQVRVIDGPFSAERCDSFPVDTIVMVNVLEHVENDREYLQTMRRMLPAGGHLLLFVPATPGIFGSLDRAFDHYRRYTKKDLSARLREAGFQIQKIRHFNFVGVAAWFAAGRLLNKNTVRASEVLFYDRWIVPVASRIENRWEPPMGQSLLAVAEVPR